MKKCVLAISAFVITACSTPVQQSSVPMDMQAVQAYQQRVGSVNLAKSSAAQEQPWVLNQSDTRPKVVNVTVRPRPVMYPSVHYGYGWGRHGHRGYYSGVGMGLGYY